MELITLKEAKKKGLLFYFTGKPCKHGHVDLRYTLARACKTCKSDKGKTEATKKQRKVFRESNKDSLSETRKQYYRNNKQSKLIASKEYYLRNKEYIVSAAKQYYADNRTIKISYSTEYNRRNKDSHSVSVKKWKSKNKHKNTAYTMKRHAAKLNATPKWLDEDSFWIIEQIYETAQDRSEGTGVKHHVDHIIPLQGELVSGLHVPENLRVVPWYENIAKGNSYSIN